MEQQSHHPPTGANVGMASGVAIGVASDATSGTSSCMAAGDGTGHSVVFPIPLLAPFSLTVDSNQPMLPPQPLLCPLPSLCLNETKDTTVLKKVSH